jgi:HSP20 family protein
MQRLTDQVLRAWGGEGRRGFAPPVDIYEDEKAIYVRAELPGTKADDVTIHVENNVLTLSGERKLDRESEREGYHRIESSYGAFSRSFALPESVKPDQVDANMSQGILTVTLPKKGEVAPKRIPIKSHAEEAKPSTLPRK